MQIIFRVKKLPFSKNHGPACSIYAVKTRVLALQIKILGGP